MKSKRQLRNVIDYARWKNKRGISDVLVILVSLFSLGVTLVLSVYIALQVRTNFGALATQEDPSGVSKDALDRTINNALGYVDFIFIAMFFMSILGIIITSFLFYAHPVFVVLFIVLSLGAVISSVFVSNIFEMFSTNDQLTSIMPYFQGSSWIFHNLPLLTACIVAISIIVIYTKPNLGQTMPG